MSTRVLLADGCIFTRDGLMVYLAQYGLEIVGQCHDWETLCVQARESFPDVIFFSSSLRGLSGPGAIQAARRQPPFATHLHWLVFGEHPTPEVVRAWL